MTVDVLGRSIVAGIGVLTIALLAPIAAIQIFEYLRRRRQDDGLQTYRLATAALVTALLTIMSWRLGIWLDLVFANGTVLGPTGGRWRLDLGIGSTILALCAFVSTVFWRDRMQAQRAVDDREVRVQTQRDRIEAVTTDTNERLRRGDIGRGKQSIVDREQADRIETTGEATHEIVRRDREEQ